jgi:hypothetical protein
MSDDRQETLRARDERDEEDIAQPEIPMPRTEKCGRSARSTNDPGIAGRARAV